jgi:MFS family permease
MALVKNITSKIFLIIVSVAISSLIIDISLSNISDITSVSTSWGFAAFIVIAVVYIIGQYLILKFVEQKSKRIRSKLPHFNKLGTIITVIQYGLTAIIIFTLLQILVNSYYYTFLLNLCSSMSYATATTVMVILVLEFFSWYRSHRDFALLSYSISFIITFISIVSSIVFFNIVLVDMPDKVTSVSQLEPVGEVGHSESEEEVGHGPDIRKFDSSTLSGKVQIVFVISRILSYLSLWTSTAILLHAHSGKLGKVKFWIIIGIPIASFISIFVIVTPFLQSLPHDNSDMDMTSRIIVDALGYTLPALASSVLFGTPFWIIARNLRYGSIVKDYMIIAASGFALFELTSSGSVILASYPPLGLASISFVGLSSYLILMGIYSSAVSISEDSRLRRAIRKFAMTESKVLDSIGLAQMEQEVQKKVLSLAKEQEEKMVEETGIEMSLDEDDIKEYLQKVINEVKRSRHP